MKPDNNTREALRWLQTAEQDLRAARWNLDGEFYNTACFQAQQAAEKSLKSFLLAQGERHVRGHSAVELLRRCMTYDRRFEALLADCRVLDRHYLPTRYPDALPDATPYDVFGMEDAADAISRAERILQAVRASLGQATPESG